MAQISAFAHCVRAVHAALLNAPSSASQSITRTVISCKSLDDTNLSCTVDFKTAFWAVPHIDSIVNSQLPLALKLLVGNSASCKMLLQALQAMCKVYCCSCICNSGFEQLK